MFGDVGGVEKCFSLPVLSVGVSLVFLVGNGYVAAECLFVLGRSFFYKFEYCFSGLLVPSPLFPEFCHLGVLLFLGCRI
jgi:hypothetical protein